MADGGECRWCETTNEAGSAGKAWPLLTRPCQPPPEPPIKDTDGYYAYLESLPGRFWTRNTPDEGEYAGELQRGRLTNLGTIRRGGPGFPGYARPGGGAGGPPGGGGAGRWGPGGPRPA